MTEHWKNFRFDVLVKFVDKLLIVLMLYFVFLLIQQPLSSYTANLETDRSIQSRKLETGLAYLENVSAVAYRIDTINQMVSIEMPETVSSDSTARIARDLEEQTDEQLINLNREFDEGARLVASFTIYYTSEERKRLRKLELKREHNAQSYMDEFIFQDIYSLEYGSKRWNKYRNAVKKHMYRVSDARKTRQAVSKILSENFNQISAINLITDTSQVD